MINRKLIKNAVIFLSVFSLCWSFNVKALSVEDLVTELGSLETRATTLQADILKAKIDPNTTSQKLTTLLSDIDSISKRALEIKGMLQSAPSAPILKVSAQPACGGGIDLAYTAPTKGTALKYVLSRNPDANQNKQWGAIFQGTDINLFPKRDTGNASDTTYSYQLSVIGQGGVEANSEIVSAKSSSACAPVNNNVSVTAITSTFCGGKIALSWTKVNPNPAGVLKLDFIPEYTIYRFTQDPATLPNNAVPDATIHITDMNQTSYADTVPNASKVYWYDIEALVQFKAPTSGGGAVTPGGRSFTFAPGSGITIVFDVASAVSSVACPKVSPPTTNIPLSCESGEEVLASFIKPGNETWTVPSNVSKIRVKVWGAGGAGGIGYRTTEGGSWNLNSRRSLAGAGGGGGGYAEATLKVTPNSLSEILVGKGGISYNGDNGELFRAGNSEFRLNVANKITPYVAAGGGGGAGNGSKEKILGNSGWSGRGQGGEGRAYGAGYGGSGLYYMDYDPNTDKVVGGGTGGFGYLGDSSITGGNGQDTVMREGNDPAPGGTGANGGTGGLAGACGRNGLGYDCTSGVGVSRVKNAQDGTFPGGGGGGSATGGEVGDTGGNGANGAVLICGIKTISVVIPNPDLTPAPNTPTVSDGEANASYVNTDDKLTYLIPGKKAKIEGGVLNIGPGIVPAGKHFNVRFQKSNTQTFDSTNVGVVDVVAPTGTLLKNGKIPVSYSYTSVAGDEGKIFYFRYCVDQPPMDDFGAVVETQGANDASVVPAVGEYNNCSGNTTIRLRKEVIAKPPVAKLQIRKSGTVDYVRSYIGDFGDQVDLKWTATDATECTASEGWVGGKDKNGGENLALGPLVKVSYVYTLTCKGPGGISEPVSAYATLAFGASCVTPSVSGASITWKGGTIPSTLPTHQNISYKYAWSSVGATPASGDSKDYTAAYDTAGEKIATFIFTATDKSVTPNIVRTANVKCQSTAIPVPICDCSAINSSLVVPQGAIVIAANTPAGGVKEIIADSASKIKLVYSSTGATSVTLYKETLDGKKLSGNLISGGVSSGEISLTSLTVGEYYYVFTATNAGGDCISKVHFNIVKVLEPILNPDLTPKGTPDIIGPAGSTWIDTSVTPNVTYYIPGTTLILKAQPKNAGPGDMGRTAFRVKFQAKLASQSTDLFQDLPNIGDVSKDVALLLTSGKDVPAENRPSVTHATSASVTGEQVWDFRYCVDMPPNDYIGNVVEKQSAYTNVNDNKDKTDRVGEYNNCSGNTIIRLKPKPPPPPPTVKLLLQVRKVGVDPYSHNPLTVNDGNRVDLKWSYDGTSSCEADWKSPSAIEKVGSDESVGPLLFSHGPYSYKVTCGNLVDTVTVNVIKGSEPLPECVISIRPLGGVYGKNAITNLGSGVEIQWFAGSATTAQLFKIVLGKAEGGSIITGNASQGVEEIKYRDVASIGDYRYKLTSSNALETKSCEVSVQVNPAPRPDLMPTIPPIVDGLRNSDNSFRSGETITLQAIPKNVGGGNAGPFNIKFQHKEETESDERYVDFPSFATVLGGLGTRLELPSAVGISHTSRLGANETYKIRYCVDFPPNGETPPGSGLYHGAIDETQISDASDSTVIPHVGEYNNCSESTTVRFAPPPVDVDTCSPFCTTTVKPIPPPIPPSVSCSVSPDPIDLATVQKATWTATVNAGTSPYIYSWTGDGVQGAVPYPPTSQIVSVTYDSSATARNIKNATVEVTDASRISDSKTSTVDCGGPETETLPQGTPLSVSCAVSKVLTGLDGKKSLTLTASTHNTGKPEYFYVWKVDKKQYSPSDPTKPTIKVPYDPAKDVPGFISGTITVTDSSTLPDPKTVIASCEVTVYNSSDDYKITASPTATMSFVGNVASSNKVHITIDDMKWFDKDITVEAFPGRIEELKANLFYTFYKNGVSQGSKAVLKKSEYADGLDMVIKADNFIPVSADGYTVTVHASPDVAGKSHDATVKLFTNDSRPKFQNF
ncbi:MAG: hypothetical protein EXS59_01660 [Candidatus Taylorbacteria bacterium]|nr:hypothetical protein [Candidatus Taylorbacteria bacterium]